MSEIFCTNKEKGCTWSGKSTTELDNHLNKHKCNRENWLTDNKKEVQLCDYAEVVCVFCKNEKLERYQYRNKFENTEPALHPDNLNKVLQAAWLAQKNFYNIGLELGITPDTLDKIAKESDTNGEALREVLKMWLQSAGKKTWKILRDALVTETVNETYAAQEVEAVAMCNEGMQFVYKERELRKAELSKQAENETKYMEQQKEIARSLIDEYKGKWRNLQDKNHELLGIRNELTRYKNLHYADSGFRSSCTRADNITNSTINSAVSELEVAMAECEERIRDLEDDIKQVKQDLKIIEEKITASILLLQELVRRCTNITEALAKFMVDPPEQQSSDLLMYKFVWNTTSDTPTVQTTVTTVYICGSFNKWTTNELMENNNGIFTRYIPLLPGFYEYKFIVDGQWKHDTQKPTKMNNDGQLNNVLTITDDNILELRSEMNFLKIQYKTNLDSAVRVLSEAEIILKELRNTVRDYQDYMDSPNEPSCRSSPIRVHVYQPPSRPSNPTTSRHKPVETKYPKLTGR